MPYIGRDLNRGNYLKLDDISSSFDSSTTTFNLTVGGSAFTPGSAFAILVSVGGVIQEPESAYQVNNSEITFANPPTAQDSFFCIALGVALGIGVPGNSTVNGTQMAKPFNYDGFFYLNDSSNRVGINSSIPTVALDVIGDIKLNGSLVTGGGGGGNFGIVTCTGLDVNGNGDVSGNFVIDGDLTVNGTTTTLDTNLTEVDKVEVAANNSTVGVAITQSGSGDILRLYDGASQVVTVDDEGKVGIGSATPGALLNLASANPIIRLTDTDNGAYSAIGGEGANLYLYTNSSSRDFIFRGSQEVARLTGDGKLGIGTHTPSGKFDVRGDAYFGNDIYLTDESGGYEKVEVGLNDIRVESKHIHSEFGVWVRSTSIGDRKNGIEGDGNELLLYSNSTEQVRIDSNGRVGIGTDPYYNLHVNFNNSTTELSGGSSGNWGGAGLRLENENTTVGSMSLVHFRTGNHADWHIGGKFVGNNSSNFVFIHEGSEKVRITNQGKIGIGTDFVDSFLKVRTTGLDENMFMLEADMGTNNNRALYIKSPTTDSASEPFIFHTGNSIQFMTDANIGLKVNSDGKIGINTTTPSTQLQIVGSTASVDSSGGTLGIRQKGDAHTDGITLTSSHTNSARIYKDANGTLHIYNTGGNSNDFVLTNGGSVGINSATPTSKFDIAPGGNSFIKFGQDADNPKIEIFRSTGQASNTHYSTEIQQILGDLVLSTAAAANLGSHSYSEKLRIKADGKVGIGTDTPSEIFHIRRNDATGPTITLENNANKAYINNWGSTGGIGGGGRANRFEINATLVSQASYCAPYHTFMVGGAGDNYEQARIDSDGITVVGEVAASQDYPTVVPLLNFNFRRNKKLEPRMVYRRTGTASFINEFGKVQFVGENEPRFEHDPNTRECLGLLIEPGGTNLINCSGSTYGSDARGGSNLGPTMQINTVEQVERPDGTVGNVRRLKAHASGSGMRWGSTSGGNTNQPYAGQMWARTVSGTASVTIDVNDVGQQTYSLTTEWVKMESVGSTSNAYRFLDVFLDGNNDIYITFIQFENLNYYPRTSSYIPVPAGQNGASRGADLVHLGDGVSGALDYTQTIGNDSGKDLTNVFNPVEGTTVVEYFNDTSTNGQYAATWDDGSGNNRMGLVNGNSYQAANNSGGTSQGSLDNGTPNTNDYNKFAFAYKYNDSALCINGNTPTEDTTFAVPTGIRYLWLGCRMGSYDFLGGTITNLKYYPKRLPSSQLKTLTTF